MNTPKAITSADFLRIRDLIENYSGILLGGGQSYLVEYRLSDLITELGMNSFSELTQRLSSDTGLLGRVVDLMTIKETYWFRDESFWKTLRERTLPLLVEKAEEGNEIRIWSAACSTGQEPYSLAILIQECLELAGKTYLSSRFKISSSDISEVALNYAMEGCFDLFSIQRGMSSKRAERFFVEKENQFYVKPEIKNNVSFFRLNLIDPFDYLGKFDVILCRNVAVYFSSTYKEKLFSKIEELMSRESVLFLGATESLYSVTRSFESFSYGNGLYFTLK